MNDVTLFIRPSIDGELRQNFVMFFSQTTSYLMLNLLRKDA